MTDALAEMIRSYWNADAATYDRAPGHEPRRLVERAAWLAAMANLLPPPPARVLDVGAGTGFLSLLTAALGHRVVAIDVAPAMLEQLARKAATAGLEVDTVEADAASPPPGPFDAVIERHLLWTLPDPVGALRRWREVAPRGRLVVVESIWGTAAGVRGRVRDRLGEIGRRLRGDPPEHHAPYPSALLGRLPFASGTSPDALLAAVAESGWPAPRLVRLRDVEWAQALQLSVLERLVGPTPRFAVVAGS